MCVYMYVYIYIHTQIEKEVCGPLTPLLTKQASLSKQDVKKPLQLFTFFKF